MHQDSKLQSDWLNENFPPQLRWQSIILTADNILTPDVLKAMLRVRKNVNSTISKDNTTWLDHCQKVPIRPWLSDDGPCMEFSILELFAEDGEFSEEALNRITPKEILDKVNDSNQSQIFHIARNFTKSLGGIEYNGSGRVISATSAMMTFFTTMNSTEALLNPVPEVPAILTSRSAFDFEEALLQTLQNKRFYPVDLVGNAAVQFSLAVEANSAINSGFPLLAIGFAFMSLYVLLMIRL